MQVSIKELRRQPSRIISMARLGGDVIITSHGKPTARIVAIDNCKEPDCLAEDMKEIVFGMWKDHDAVDDPSAYVATLRKGRSL